MIGSLHGEVIDKTEESVLLEVGGVGYVVLAPTTLLDNLRVGIRTQLVTHLHVREQELTLFGFPNKEELELFRLLLKVQGIGPKVALAILSHLPAETLRQAVAREEAALFARVPGIGPKKAKQIVFQLRDKVGLEDVFETTTPFSDTDGEVIAALTTLGYSVVEAQSALQQLPPEAKEESTEEKVRLALSSLAKL
ncbi:MAG: Holliday junction branch migration protein RuvA [Anaerolineae bacterium]|nr:Holliday junction branch migration protein RuvA [Anaerolineae bacterium]MCB0178065.1 Holliday junction branch migration protein RuvA [Anaerolineae bacterium]MCB0225728.1 Holliday junction branch migration protein RuvA [Anaerolineae bacterium]MCB9106673.1 Holliday junction branch migration protein RuvA [Anaerolineales bacterium]